MTTPQLSKLPGILHAYRHTKYHVYNYVFISCMHACIIIMMYFMSIIMYVSSRMRYVHVPMFVFVEYTMNHIQWWTNPLIESLIVSGSILYWVKITTQHYTLHGYMYTGYISFSKMKSNFLSFQSRYPYFGLKQLHRHKNKCFPEYYRKRKYHMMWSEYSLTCM